MIRAAIVTNLRVQQSSRIGKNLVGAAAAHAKEALTVRIVLVTADSHQLAAFYLDQHSAKRWMAVHGTHGSDNFRIANGHRPLRLGHRSKSDPIRDGLGCHIRVVEGRGWQHPHRLTRPGVFGDQSCASPARILAYTVVGAMLP